MHWVSAVGVFAVIITCAQLTSSPPLRKGIPSQFLGRWLVDAAQLSEADTSGHRNVLRPYSFVVKTFNARHSWEKSTAWLSRLRFTQKGSTNTTKPLQDRLCHTPLTQTVAPRTVPTTIANPSLKEGACAHKDRVSALSWIVYGIGRSDFAIILPNSVCFLAVILTLAVVCRSRLRVKVAV